MPRMSEADKQKSHRRILDAAARILRADGVEATGVATVMEAAGMTHGGFYKHFKSRDDMLAAAVDHATQSVLGPVEVKRAGGDDGAPAAYASDYLSDAHRRNRGSGCPLAAIAGEALRETGPIRDAAERAALRTVRLLSGDGDEREAMDDFGFASLSVLVGSIVIARLLQEESEAERVLQLGQNTLDMLRDAYA